MKTKEIKRNIEKEFFFIFRVRKGIVNF